TMLVTVVLVGLAAQFLPGTPANCDCPLMYTHNKTGKTVVTDVDHKFLCRVAWVESRFGAHPNTFKTGGIWQVTKGAWNETVNHPGPKTQEYRKLIQEKLGIDWTKTKYEDIVKVPMLNGLAARLYIARITPKPIQKIFVVKIKYWKDHYNTPSS
ncbi:hypothetical protein OS493_039545, partial [Desmophyllum pertusum]